MGSPFPGIVERVIYNVQGSRVINANNGVAANILAPNAQYKQTQGVTYGKVIVGDVIEARQNNKPNCIDFSAVTITQKNLKPVQAGDDFVYVYDLTAYIPGDLLCINGACRAIVSGQVGDVDGDGTTDHVAHVDAAFPAFAAAMTDVTTTVADPASANRSESLPTYSSDNSSASTLLASTMFVAIALML